MPNQVNNGVSEGIFSPSDISNINNNLDKLTNNVNELVNKISEKEKRELEEEKRIKEEKEKLSKEQEKEEKAYQEEKEEFLQQITLLVENSDQQETFTYQQQTIEKLDKIIMQNEINYIFMGVFIALGCVNIFQKAFLKR